MQARLGELTRSVLPLTLAGGGVVALLGVLWGRPLRESVASGVAIAIAAEGELAAAVTGEFIAPCGRCRQVLAEAVAICGHDIEVLMLSRDGLRVRSTTAQALLPLAFGL